MWFLRFPLLSQMHLWANNSEMRTSGLQGPAARLFRACGAHVRQDQVAARAAHAADGLQDVSESDGKGFHEGGLLGVLMKSKSINDH
jgi:hypothetical protein